MIEKLRFLKFQPNRTTLILGPSASALSRGDFPISYVSKRSVVCFYSKWHVLGGVWKNTINLYIAHVKLDTIIIYHAYCAGAIRQRKKTKNKKTHTVFDSFFFDQILPEFSLNLVKILLKLFLWAALLKVRNDVDGLVLEMVLTVTSKISIGWTD